MKGDSTTQVFRIRPGVQLSANISMMKVVTGKITSNSTVTTAKMRKRQGISLRKVGGPKSGGQPCQQNEAEANQSWDDQMYSNPQYQRHMNQRGQPLHERCAKEASLSCLRGRDSSLHQVFGALVRNQKGSHIPRHHRQDFTSS